MVLLTCAGAIAYVQEGDTLAAIAERYNGVDVDALVELNPTEDGPLCPCADLTGCFESVALPLGSKFWTQWTPLSAAFDNRLQLSEVIDA